MGGSAFKCFKILHFLESYNAYHADYLAGDALHNVWWFQEGAPAHRLRDVRNVLTHTSGDRLVALGTNVEWPARSPDLTPLDFFLWVT